MSASNTAEIVTIRPANTTVLQGLCELVINEAGDFIFIPADVPHQPVNLSATESAKALVRWNDPNEQRNFSYPG